VVRARRGRAIHSHPVGARVRFEASKGAPLAIRVGQKIPEIKIKTSGMKDISTGELYAGKKVELFAVPDAFTPTCSE
jgi:peroxiredoxin